MFHSLRINNHLVLNVHNQTLCLEIFKNPNFVRVCFVCLWFHMCQVMGSVVGPIPKNESYLSAEICVNYRADGVKGFNYCLDSLS